MGVYDGAHQHVSVSNYNKIYKLSLIISFTYSYCCHTFLSGGTGGGGRVVRSFSKGHVVKYHLKEIDGRFKMSKRIS